MQPVLQWAGNNAIICSGNVLPGALMNTFLEHAVIS